MEQSTFDAIIAGIADLVPVTRACDLAGVTRGAFYYAVSKDPMRAVQYARALECKVEGYAEETIEIADTEADPQKARNRIQARQWYSGKIAPKRFGDRLDLTVTPGADAAALHAEGLKRARLLRDPAQAALPQVIEGTTVVIPAATDSQSVAPSIFD
jgi:terminase small subunit-like protein